MVISADTDKVTVPPIFIEDTPQGAQIARDQQCAAVLIIDIPPMTVTDIRLITHDVVIYHVRTVLDTAIDKTRCMIAR